MDILLSFLLNTSWNSRASLSSIQASFPTMSLSELFHEASSLVRLPFWTLIIPCSFAFLYICPCCVSCLEWLLWILSSRIKMSLSINVQFKSYLLEAISDYFSHPWCWIMSITYSTYFYYITYILFHIYNMHISLTGKPILNHLSQYVNRFWFLRNNIALYCICLLLWRTEQ